MLKPFQHSDKQWSCHLQALCILEGFVRSYIYQWTVMKEKVAAPVQNAKNKNVGVSHADQMTPTIRKSWQ
jgi:hypothetical protein